MLDTGTTGIIVGILLFFMLTFGVHIGVALGLSGVVGIFLAINPQASFAQVATIPYPYMIIL